MPTTTFSPTRPARPLVVTIRSALVFANLNASRLNGDDEAKSDFSRIVARASDAAKARDVSEIRAALLSARRRLVVANATRTKVSFTVRIQTFAYGVNAPPRVEAAVVLGGFENDLAAAAEFGWSELVDNVTASSASLWSDAKIDTARSLGAIASTTSNFTAPASSDDERDDPWAVYYAIALTCAIIAMAGATAVFTFVHLRRYCALKLKPARRIEPIMPEAKPTAEYKPPLWAFED